MLFSHFFRVCALFLILSQSLVAQSRTLAVELVPVKGLGSFIIPPVVVVTDTSVLLVSSDMERGKDVVELDPGLSQVQARYRIRPGQGPCEGNGLEILGAIGRKLYFLRHGNNEVVAFNENGTCNTACRSLHLENSGTLVDPSGYPDRFVASNLRIEGGQAFMDVILVEDFSKIRILMSHLPARPLPPLTFLTGNVLVATCAAENTRNTFQVHLVDTDGGNMRKVTVPFVSPKTKYEIRRGRAELKRHGMTLPEKILKQKRLSFDVFDDDDNVRVFFIETVERSKAIRKKYLHTLNLKTGKTGLFEIPFHFTPRTILGGACIGFLENDKGDFGLAEMGLPPSR